MDDRSQPPTWLLLTVAATVLFLAWVYKGMGSMNLSFGEAVGAAAVCFAVVLAFAAGYAIFTGANGRPDGHDTPPEPPDPTHPPGWWWDERARRWRRPPSS